MTPASGSRLQLMAALTFFPFFFVMISHMFRTCDPLSKKKKKKTILDNTTLNKLGFDPAELAPFLKN